MRALYAALSGTFVLVAACASPKIIPLPGAPADLATLPVQLSATEITQLIPARIAGREAWAKEIAAALRAHKIDPSAPSVCAVVAVIAQESGFHANPVVPGLAPMVKERLEEYSHTLGPLGPPIMKQFLQGRAPSTEMTFEQRLSQVETERDLDRIFRDLLSYYHHGYPSAYAVANATGSLLASTPLAALNPITTAGSMQVSVQFSEAWARSHRVASENVRDSLYTLPGGVFYGSLRLLGYQAGYSQMLYRFADYNAGMYASRNSALQKQLSALTKLPLDFDGDFLEYTKSGEAAGRETHSLKALHTFIRQFPSRLTNESIRDDLNKEKSPEFEQTLTYRTLRQTYRRVIGENPPYAQLPVIQLSSPKLKKSMSSASYAQAVNGRYGHCLKQASVAPAPHL